MALFARSGPLSPTSRQQTFSGGAGWGGILEDMKDKLTRLHAKSLFRQGWKIADIAGEVGVAEKTVRLWRDAEGWATQLSAEEALEARIAPRVTRADKSDPESHERGRLMEALTRLERGKAKAIKDAGRQDAVEAPAGEGAGAARRPICGRAAGAARRCRPSCATSWDCRTSIRSPTTCSWAAS